VLLTEQGPNGQRSDSASTLAAAPSVVDQVLSSAGAQSASAWPWTGQVMMVRAAMVAGLLMLAIFTGWLMSRVQSNMSATPESATIYMNPDETNSTLSSTPTPDANTSGDSMQGASDQAPLEQTPFEQTPFEQTPSEQSPSDYQEPGMNPPQPESRTDVQPSSTPEISAESSNDVGTVDVNDPAALERMLADNPDAVAAALNAIEPGNTDSSTPAPPTATSAPEKLAAADPAPDKAPVPAPAAPVASETASKPAAQKVAAISRRPDGNLPESVKAIEKEALAGVPEAQHDLAAIYTAGQGGVKQDYERAAFWFRKAADQGVANAAYNLGVLQHQGLGTKQDLNEAIRWYTKAAKLGHPEAQYNLGIAYIEGIGVPYDPAKAASNFESAADQGITEAAYNLGLIYENGLLGAAKPAEALKWYKTAADQGSPEATEALKQLARTLNVKVDDIKRVADTASPVASVSTPVNTASRQALTAQIQDYLMKSGLYPGPADGASNLQTEDAIRAYQRGNNLPLDGKITQDLLQHMLGNERR